jgi:hypothetical protein
MLQKLLSLFSALIFPVLAVLSQFPANFISQSLGRDLAKKIIYMLLITAIGILLMLGSLSDTRFMLGTAQFAGVKFAFILPLLFIAFYYYFRPASFPQLKERIMAWLDEPVKILFPILGMVLLGLGVVLLLRSGNFSLPVPGFEKIFRRSLEGLLSVRPRTKELLVGYPFLVLASIYYLKGKREWFWLLISLGAVALVSFTNTFCHIHSPLLVSIFRSVNGLVLGIILGICYYGVLKILKRGLS